MAKKEELGKLSPEQLKKLGNVISEAKDLTNQQAEIIEKILAGEEQIGIRRISYLEKYFGRYYEELDKIARKHNELNDAFLILDTELNKNYKSLASDIAKLASQLKDISNESGRAGNVNQTERDEKSTDEAPPIGELVNEVKNILNNGIKLSDKQLNSLLKKFDGVKINKKQYTDLLKVIREVATSSLVKGLQTQEPDKPESPQTAYGSMTDDFKEALKGAYAFSTELFARSFPAVFEYTPSDNGTASNAKATAEAAATSDGASSPPAGGVPPVDPPMPPVVEVKNTYSDEEVAALKDENKTREDFKKFLDEIAKDGIKAYTQEAKVKAEQIKRNEELIKTWAKTEDEIRSSVLKLSIAKLQTQEELENRSIEIRLNRLKDATDAELKAQELLNKIDLQLAETQDKRAMSDVEAGDARARKTNADLNVKAYQELEKQMAEYRAKLDLETMLETGEALTAEQAAANEKLTRDLFAARKDAIIKEARDELLAKQQLANLSKTNPKVAQEYEKRLSEYRAELDRKSMIANNGILTEEAAKANARLTQEYAANNKKIILEEIALKQKLGAELAEATKNDPSVAQEYEKRMAEYKAQLDLESRRANNGILKDDESKANEKLAQAYFATRRDELLKEIAAEKQFKAELAEAAKTNSKAVQELEREMAKAQADLDRESRRANNGILTQEAAEQNAKLVRLNFDARKEELLKEFGMRQVAEEDIARLRENNSKLSGALEEKRAKYRAKLELESRKKNNGILTDDEAKRIKGLVDKRYDLEGKEMEKLAKRQQKDDEKDAKRESRKQIDEVASAAISKDNNLLDRFTVLKQATENKVTDLGGDEGDEKVAKAIAGLDTAMTLLSDLAKKLEGAVDKIGAYQGTIDTRLQGSKNDQHKGSYWGQLTRDMMSVGAVTPYFKQEKFAENIKSLVEKGISFDLKQRAFLMTIQEKIANTFNVADGTLLRLIRLQQEDSTAGRLGMESALNSFLNEMYETSEYLSDVAASVRTSLEEMESLMKGAEATEVEFQVQKWMGSLYSVGMSQNAVNTISTALGQIASGQVDALTGNGAGNLLVMAANEAGLSIAEILSEGLDSKNTNKLLQATVDYLAEIAESSKGNNVVQQQLANVFGVKASDLRAAINLKSDPSSGKNSTSDIYGTNLTYDNMLRQLNNMANTMGDRTSWGEKLTNIWENGQYTLASSLANSPAAYLIYKLAGLLDSTVGGIDLPFINVMGFGVDLNTTVADLMRVASVSAGIISNLGPMVSGLANSFSGQAMLTKMGISKGLEVNTRGKGDGISSTGNQGGGSSDLSSSGYVGQSNGNDIKNSTIKESEDSKKKQMIKAKEEEPANQVDVLNNTVIKIYELLDSVAKGNKALRVKVDNYGLIGSNTTNTSTELSNNKNNSFGSTGSAGGTGGTNASDGSSYDGSTGGFNSNSNSGHGASGGAGSVSYGSGNYGSSNNYGSYSGGGSYGSGSYGSNSSASVGTGGSGYGSSGSGVGSGGTGGGVSIDFGGWNMV